ncbi:hypothetical protein PSA7680_02202 [Pseudoruegeria aquimaris]|uniref:Uncharacterized protein n=1 Tax=Pseudoruegeria aquimaris TaxID=393663 RepID=A0A1Y5SPE0_9RHOB|nr:hypothetical protein [Pseudoruegeria aquimaris]SLN43635.1 hypothetical protein PSA7680_02202 [Pseudoruegeria aquimaris]
MLQDKRQDLDAEKQRRLLQRLVEELSRTHGELYYQPTSQIAMQLESYIDGEAKLFAEERALLKRLTRRDIEVLLSLH